jgi:translation initiation factor IF-2
MPSKSKSSSPASSGEAGATPKKSAARSAAPKSSSPAPEETPAPAPAVAKQSSAEMKEGALDLLERPKRNRNATKTAEGKATVGKPATPAPEPVAPPKDVLSLIDGAKPRRPRVAGAGSAVVKPISRILAERDEARQPTIAALSAPLSSPPADEPVVEATDSDDKVISIKPPIIVSDLAAKMGLKVFVLIKDLMAMDIFANPTISIEPETASKICEKHGFTFERERREKGAGVHKAEEVNIAPPPAEEVIVEERLVPRAPIITFMGHVDHGKTSLIDALRKTRVVAGEAGGITQHIGAYQIPHGEGTITVLDTPGHAAFSAMRARGAHITDIVVLVVAADDGIMPQTKEAIAHAKAAKVKIVVAINKCDLKTANLDRVKMQLQDEGLMPEEWGGETMCVEVSATKGTGIDKLLESALLEAEILELRADPKAPCRALVIESRVEPGRGPTATIIPQVGTLRIGTPFICGSFFGKVKGMLNDLGKPIKEAGPAMPVEVLGFSDLPNVGEELMEMDSERDAKRLSEERSADRRMEKLSAPRRATLETLFASMEPGARKYLKVVLKTDVQGSLEAIGQQLREIKSDKVTCEFLLEGVGPITENDIVLASASDAIVLGFGVKVEGKAVKTARSEGVQVKLYSIIYELIDQVREAMLGMLEQETREKITGHAQVKQLFKINKGWVAGCVVTDGRIQRKAHARVVRGRQPVYDGGFHTLRRFADDVDEVRNGLECGIRLGEFNEYEVGDIIECYEVERFDQTL